MTIEQALKIKQYWTAEQARNDLERWLLRGESPEDKVIALACKALEKQIPRKVTFGYDEQDDIKCPNCDYVISYMDAYDKGVDKYCSNCGQRLDWGDEE